jgi:iduronate 2-sulfatase
MHQWILLALCALAAFPAAGRGAETRRPNILLICVDDLKPLLGCYGDERVKSPHIDRLAARGVRFEKAYCNQAVCAPSRNSLLTGRRPTTLGIYDLATHFRLAAPGAVTLPQYFKQQGWRTEGLGKIFHVGHGNHEDPASWSVPHWNPRVSGLGGGYALPENRAQPATRESARFANTPEAQAANLPRGAAVESADVPDNTYADGLIAEEAIRRLQAAKDRPEAPFFLAVGFHKPHLPFVAPKKYWDIYQRASFNPHPLQKPPEGAPAFAPTSWGELRQYSDIPDTGPLTPETQRLLIHGYHAAVSYMDAQLGRVLDELDRLGLAQNTILVLWGDHGWHLGDHGMWSKHTNYEQAARIPFIMCLPGSPQGGAQSAALVESVDLYPTLCELAGLPVPAGLDGASFAAALKNPASAPTKKAVFHVFPRSPRGLGNLLGRAVRTERYRLVEWKAAGAPAATAILELYDYQADPDETRNLAGEQPEVVAQLRALLNQQPEAKPQFKAPAAGSQTQARNRQTGPNRAAMFARRDRDGDGRLTREEFLINQADPAAARQRFTAFDTNGDGFLSREEFITMGGKK